MGVCVVLMVQCLQARGARSGAWAARDLSSQRLVVASYKLSLAHMSYPRKRLPATQLFAGCSCILNSKLETRNNSKLETTRNSKLETRNLSKLPRVPFDDAAPDQQCRNRANAQEDAKRQQHLHVSFTLAHHQSHPNN